MSPVLLNIVLLVPLSAQFRTMETVVPSLAYGPTCSSTLNLQNLSDRTVTVEVAGHRESGPLVPLEGLAATTLHLRPQEHSSYRLKIEEETTGAWASIRESVPTENSPAIAVSASTECCIANQLRSTARSVAYPTGNPWFLGDVAEIGGDLVSLINTSESAVRATACYSSGGLYSVPGINLQPICDATLDVQVPPSRQFPVSRNGNSHLDLKTHGAALVLEMLRPLGENVHIYAVDSTVRFGEEVTAK